MRAYDTTRFGRLALLLRAVARNGRAAGLRADWWGRRRGTTTIPAVARTAVAVLAVIACAIAADAKVFAITRNPEAVWWWFWGGRTRIPAGLRTRWWLFFHSPRNPADARMNGLGREARPHGQEGEEDGAKEDDTVQEG